METAKNNVTFEHEEESYETEPDEEVESVNRAFNKFQLLELDDNTEVIDSESDIKDESEGEEHVLKQRPSSNVPSSQKHKQRKLRRKNKNNKGLGSNIIEETEEPRMKGEDSKETVCYNSKLLKLDTRNLIPDNELKRMFGKSVLREEKNKEQRVRHAGASTYQRSRFVSSNHSESKLIQLGSGPKMEFDQLFNHQQNEVSIASASQKGKTSDSKKEKAAIMSSDNQSIYFKFVHDKSYQSAHSLFLEFAQLGHSEGIVQNLTMHPTHIESLVQLSDMIRISEDFKTASELIERALLIFERGFHQKFNIALGTCRLSYRRPENRTFFIVMFKHISYLNRRGLRKTPLEYTKLLLSLLPENDPLFATLLIDFYAIRSEEYDYLIEFYAEWQQLNKLPNMNFSIALAHFMKSRNSKRTNVDNEESLKLADELLKTALIRYPNFIIPLLDACSAEPDLELKKCDYFDYSVYSKKYKTVPESVDLLISLYVQRTSVLWKSKPVLTWLERNLAELVKKFASNELKDEQQQINYWSTFQGPVPRNLLRHIVLSDLKVKLPPSATGSSILDIDPYPPESIYSYTVTTPSSRRAVDSGSQSRGISGLFLRSMLPSFDLGGQPDVSQIVSLDQNQMIELDGQLVDVQEQLLNDEDVALNLDLVQNSINSVLSSLSNLLSGVENHQQNPDEPQEEEHRD